MPSGVKSRLGWYPKYVFGDPAFQIPVTDDNLQVVQDCNEYLLFKARRFGMGSLET